MSSKKAQQRVFVKWVALNLKNGGASSTTSEETLLDDFQKGVVLLHLIESLSGKSANIKVPNSNNKLQVMGFLTNVLQFVSDQGIKLTISAENIYDKDETMVFGFIWLLILKFQVGQKKQIQEWLKELLGVDITNFDAQWRDGRLFCQLVNTLGSLKTPVPEGNTEEDIRARLEYGFSTAESKLGIFELLTADDVVQGFLDERCGLTYLSAFYNKYHDKKPKEPEPVLDDSKIRELEAKILELQEEVKYKDAVIDKTSGEVQLLVKGSGKLVQELRQQREANQSTQKIVRELQLKFELMQQKPSESTIPPPTGNQVNLVIMNVDKAQSLWEANAQEMAESVQQAQQILRSINKKCNGYEAEPQGERLTFAFNEPVEAMEFALQAQKQLQEAEWPALFIVEKNPVLLGLPLTIAIHQGPCAFLFGKYTGPTEKVTTRMATTCRAGEILISEKVLSAVQGQMKDTDSTVYNAQLYPALQSFHSDSLGSYTVKEANQTINVIQVFPESLKQRASLYTEYEFFTEEEKQQQAMNEKLSQLQQDNELLKEQLLATEEQAKKARDRAIELNSFLEKSRQTMRQTIGEQIQAAMKEVTSLIRQSEELELQLNDTSHKLEGARTVMASMNSTIKSMSVKNGQLKAQLDDAELKNNLLAAEVMRLEERKFSNRVMRKLGISKKKLSSSTTLSLSQENLNSPPVTDPTSSLTSPDRNGDKDKKDKGKKNEKNEKKLAKKASSKKVSALDTSVGDVHPSDAPSPATLSKSEKRRPKKDEFQHAETVRSHSGGDSEVKKEKSEKKDKKADLKKSVEEKSTSPAAVATDHTDTDTKQEVPVVPDSESAPKEESKSKKKEEKQKSPKGKDQKDKQEEGVALAEEKIEEKHEKNDDKKEDEPKSKDKKKSRKKSES